MDTRPYHELTARQAVDAMRAGTLTAGALTEACLERIAARDPVIRAWAHLDRASARRQAELCDSGPPRGPLHGIPVGVKDIIDTAGLPTEYGSPIYAGNCPKADAACVALVRRAGGIVFGKTVTTEFACFEPGKTANPHNTAYTPGGSSSGSAAAVADCHVPLAFATQTVGSTIRPAAFCGIVGYKPSFNTFSTVGVKPLSSSFDTLSMLTRTVDDALLFSEALLGVSLSDPAPQDVKRLGFCRTPYWASASPDMQARLVQVADLLRDAGIVVEDVRLPDWFERMNEVQHAIVCYEVARNFAYEQEKPRRALLSPSFTEMIEAGWRIAPQSYATARADTLQAREQMRILMRRFDMIMAPSSPGEAPRGLGHTGDPVFNRLWTLLGLPAVSIPIGTGANRLPLGAQFIGGLDQDLKLLRQCQAIEALIGAGNIR